MAKPRPEKKRQKAKPVQPRLHGVPRPLPPDTTRILPMQLQIGDRMTESTGEWEVIGRPYAITGGKYARVRVQMFGQPAISELRTWGAHEHVSVKRTTSEEGKR